MESPLSIKMGCVYLNKWNFMDFCKQEFGTFLKSRHVRIDQKRDA